MGILTLTLSVLVSNTDELSPAAATASNKALKMMIKDSFLAMLFFGTRINIAKYCSRILSPWSFIKLNFYAEGTCAFFVMTLSAFEVINVPFNLYFDPATLALGLPGGVFFVCAEIFVVLALNEGLTGPVSAIISFSVVFVSILTWGITGIALTWMQIVGIAIALAGIITVSLS